MEIEPKNATKHKWCELICNFLSQLIAGGWDIWSPWLENENNFKDEWVNDKKTSVLIEASV